MWVLNGEKTLKYENMEAALANTFRADGTKIRKCEFPTFSSGDTVYKKWTVYHSVKNTVTENGKEHTFTKKLGVTVLKPFTLEQV